MTEKAVNLTRVFVGLGSNTGDRALFLSEAANALRAYLRSVRVASLYETLPRDVTDQPPFLNTVAEGWTALAPQALLAAISATESALGRVRDESRPRGPRAIDLDILLYGSEVIDSDDLIVPHPRMVERKFVLVPLVELDPTLRHPVSGRLFQAYLESLEPQGIYYFCPTSYIRPGTNLRR